MALSQANREGLMRLLGVSQDYIDSTKQGAEEIRAWRRTNRGPTPEFHYESSDTDFGDAAPPSPPKSPPPQLKGDDGPDLSRNAWKTHVLRDLGRCIGNIETGFADYEVWRAHVLSEHAKIPPTLGPDSKVSSTPTRVHMRASRERGRPATLVSHRVTRSKASASSLFYELGHDGKTAKRSSTPSLIGVQRCQRLPHAGDRRQTRKGRSPYPVWKK